MSLYRCFLNTTKIYTLSNTYLVFASVEIPDTLIVFISILSVAAIPVKLEPSPEKLVAVTTPTAFKPPAKILAYSQLAPTESTLVTSLYVNVPALIPDSKSSSLTTTPFVKVGISSSCQLFH